MKKIYILLFAMLTTMSAMAQNPVPNPGFENWSGSPLSPANWSSYNALTQAPITQVAGHTGSYAAMGTVILYNSNVVSPLMWTGISTNGFPVTRRYSTLQFYYKTNLLSGDVLDVTASIYDVSGTFLASNYFDISTSNSTFTLYSLTIDSVAAGTPDHAFVSFTIYPSTGSDPHVGSYYIVDDVALVGGATGINEIAESNGLVIYPNPVHSTMKIKADVKEDKAMHLLLTDAIGKTILQRQSSAPVNGRIEDVLNLETIPAGVYSLMLTGENENILRRVIIE